jgi:hypothetical protein
MGKAATLILGIGSLLLTKDFESCALEFTETHCAFCVFDLGVQHWR